MLDITLTKEQEEQCRCPTCSTLTLNKLTGAPFCAKGTSKKAMGLKLHNGCSCIGCQMRKKHDIVCRGVLYCMLEDGKHTPGAFEEGNKVGEASKDAPDKVEIVTTPAGADAGAIEPDMPKKE